MSRQPGRVYQRKRLTRSQFGQFLACQPRATAFDNAIAKLWKPARTDEPKPRFHDLRKTGATRVEAVSSHAVARTFLGHSDRDVTDTYIVATLDAVRDAINRAARSIDGETPAGTIPFPTGTAQTASGQAAAAQ